MLFFVVGWTIFLSASLCPGLLTLQLSHAQCFDRIGDRLVLSLWIGVNLLGVVMLAATLFCPLTPLVALIVAGGAVAISMRSPGVRAELGSLLSTISPRYFCIYLLLVIAVAAFMVQPIVSIDAALYHIQSVKWLSQYGSVPGVAMIHGRLGLTSSWFALAAPFHAGIFAARSTAIMGGVGLCLLLFHGAFLAYRFATFRARYEDWFISTAYLICLPYILGLDIAVSSSPDLPILYITIIVAWAIVIISKLLANNHWESNVDARLVPLILSAGAITIKLSAAPLFVVSLLFYLWGKRGIFQRIALTAIISSLMIIPVLVTGVITSGCALYPSPFLCFDLPWAVGPELAGKMNLLNQNYARWRDYSSPAPFTWIIPWMKINVDSVVFVISMIFCALIIAKSKKLLTVHGRFYVLLIAALGILFVLFTIPTRRFGLGYFALAPALVAPYYRKIAYPLIVIFPLALEIDWRNRLIRALLLTFCLIAFIYILIAKNSRLQKVAPTCFFMLGILLSVKVILTAGAMNAYRNIRDMNIFLAPPAVSKTWLEIWETKQVNDFKYTQSVRPYPDGRCWAAELPCTPWLLHENIKLRDPERGLGAGVVKVKD